MKKWKIITSIIAFLLVVGAGTIYYFLDIKEYKTADTKVEDIVEDDYQVKLPDETPQEGNSNEVTDQQSDQQTVSQGSGTAKAEFVANTNSSNRVVNKTNHTKNIAVKTSSKPTAASIIAKYQPTFQDLEGQADSKLNALLSYAFSEYQTKKASGEEISYFYFYSKYNSAAKKLEASTDSSFNYVYNALVKELEKSGYSSTDAKTIKEHYLSVKKQKRSSLMNRAVEQLK